MVELYRFSLMLPVNSHQSRCVKPLGALLTTVLLHCYLRLGHGRTVSLHVMLPVNSHQSRCVKPLGALLTTVPSHCYLRLGHGRTVSLQGNVTSELTPIKMCKATWRITNDCTLALLPPARSWSYCIASG